MSTSPAAPPASSPGRLAAELRDCHSLVAILDGPRAGPKLRVGIVYRESGGWAAQTSFLHMFASSLAAVAAEGELVLGLISARDANGLCRVPARTPGQRWFQLPASGGRSSLEATAEHHAIDVIIDLFGVPQAVPSCGIITWIPDFQHHHLPHFFTEGEHQARNESFLARTKVSDFILLSSQSAKADADRFLPEALGRAQVAPFPSGLLFNALPTGNPADAAGHYHLPEKFLLVANQYWVHKNHLAVIEALGLLAAQGLRVPAVFTGLPADYRDATNAPTSRILQGIAERGLAGQVVPLGQIPFPHLIQLMRRAALVIQPSRFEGWSTVVQDIKGLGRPLICSDLPVHREQAPQALGFFGCDDPPKLAELIGAHWKGLSPGPDLAAEARSLEQERRFARTHGMRLAELCRNAFDLARGRSKA